MLAAPATSVYDFQLKTIDGKDFSLAQTINDLNEEAIRLTKDDLQRRFKA